MTSRLVFFTNILIVKSLAYTFVLIQKLIKNQGVHLFLDNATNILITQ